MSTNSEKRRELILDEVRRRGYVASVELAARTGVSDMTIRRDMRLLEHEGLVRRIPGGVGLPANQTHQPIDGVLPFGVRDDRARDAKIALCRAAVDLVAERTDVSLIGVDAGTTVAPLARLLPAGMTVVTNSLPMLQVASSRDDIGLIGLGGTWLAETQAFCGIETRRQLEELTLDVAVISCAAVTARGLFSAHAPDVDVKRALIKAADTVICLADGSKFEQRALMRFAEFAEIDLLLTNVAAPAWLRDSLEVREVRG